MRIVFLIPFFFFLTSGNSQELDLSFGGVGYVSVPNTLFFSDIIVLENGQIQTVGVEYTYPGNISKYHTQLTLFNPDGSIDTNFGDNGYVNLIIGDRCAPVTYKDHIYIQTDNKIVVVGTYQEILYTTPKHTFIARFNQDGSLDTTFADAGILQYSINEQIGEDTDSSVMLENEKIICLSYSNGYFFFSRIDPDGSLDMHFGTDGILQLDLGAAYPYYNLHTLFLLPDEKILATGSLFENNGNEKLLVARFHTDGSLDTGYGVDGVFIYDVNPAPAVVEYSMTPALQSDGKILVSGAASNNSVFFRLTDVGILDTTFGANGIVLSGSELFQILSIVVQPNDKFISCGPIDTNIVMTKFLQDGAFDTSFGEDGFYYLNINTNNSTGESIKLQEDGKILIGGSSRAIGEPADAVIIRLHNNENIGVEEQIINNNISLYPNPVTNLLIINHTDVNIQKVQLFNSLGQSVLVEHSSFNNINVSCLVKGTYVVKIETESGILVRKVIKQ